MIRKITVVSLFLQLIILSASAQTVLTYANNAMKEGDIISLKMLKKNVAPGETGAFRMWDFSNVEFDEAASSISYTADSSKPQSSSKAFACSQEAGRTTYYDITASAKLYKELRTPSGNIVFDEPIKELAFPFRYGDKIQGKLQGTYTTNTGVEERIDGDYSVTADAHGTLILPNGITLKNVLRVKYEKVYQQLHSGALYNIAVVHYLFYAAESRYPVFQINESKSACDCACSFSNHAAYFNDQVKPGAVISLPETNASLMTGETVTYKIYPNPFVDKLKFDYSLSKDLNLQVSLFDLQGKQVTTLINTLQKEGSYIFEQNLKYLPEGTYILRINADGQIFSEKVIKEK